MNRSQENAVGISGAAWTRRGFLRASALAGGGGDLFPGGDGLPWCE
ncbi:MAG: twin-arginine translocation signal domain-containing protein [Verrucomicrobiota bacterium]